MQPFSDETGFLINFSAEAKSLKKAVPFRPSPFGDTRKMSQPTRRKVSSSSEASGFEFCNAKREIKVKEIVVTDFHRTSQRRERLSCNFSPYASGASLEAIGNRENGNVSLAGFHSRDADLQTHVRIRRLQERREILDELLGALDICGGTRTAHG